MHPAQFSLKVGHKHAVIGSYEAGKTTFCKWLSWQAPRALVFDPIHEWAGSADLEHVARRFSETGRAVYQPYTDPATVFEAFCQVSLNAANTLIVIDEPTEVMDAHTRLAGKDATYPAFRRLWRLGHKRGLGVALATHQLVGDMPKLLRGTQHTWVFQPTTESDRERLEKQLGTEAGEWLKDPPTFQCWHAGPQHAGPFGPIQPPPAKP